MTAIALTVNGEAVEGDVEPRTHLADFLREHRNLTGTNLGCEQGVCGACTVLADKGGLHEHDRKRAKTGTGY